MISGYRTTARREEEAAGFVRTRDGSQLFDPVRETRRGSRGPNLLLVFLESDPFGSSVGGPGHGTVSTVRDWRLAESEADRPKLLQILVPELWKSLRQILDGLGHPFLLVVGSSLDDLAVIDMTEELVSSPIQEFLTTSHMHLLVPPPSHPSGTGAGDTCYEDNIATVGWKKNRGTKDAPDRSAPS